MKQPNLVQRMFQSFFYSFPAQLLLLHLKKNQILIGCWLFIILIVNQKFGKLLGIPYLFLEPEYLNKVNFWSFFIVGITLGGFVVAFHITCYILDGHKYNFLGILQRPFAKFLLNNSVIPTIGLLFYLGAVINFQVDNDVAFSIASSRILGLIVGTALMMTVLLLYFRLTNKDIFKFLTGSVDEVLKSVKVSRQTVMNRLREARKGGYRVDNYLNLKFKPCSTAGLHDFYDKETVLRIFDQNHFNSVIIELFILLLILVLGWFVDVAVFQIPAAASVILILTIVVMIYGLISYWTREWSVTVVLALFLALNGLWQAGALKRENEAYGLNYNTTSSSYNRETLAEFSSVERYGTDKLAALDILENWKAKQPSNNPAAIFACVSGGGQRAALWTFNAMQRLDSLLDGKLMTHTVLITGASGGMVGAAYFRELYLRSTKGEITDLLSPEYRQNISTDNLNPIIFSLLVNDIFLRKQPFQYGGYEYSKNRGYAFENQLNKNTKGVLEKRLIDYLEPEQKADIPMMILSPTIVNDGRKLYISPHGISYMTLANEAIDGGNVFQVTGVDFNGLFKEQNSPNLRFLTALRMSATFPYVTPNIKLPSEPQIELMDAGISDNYGISDAIRFLYVFRNWFSENTSDVIFLSIRDTEKDPNIDLPSTPSIIQKIGAPISSVYNNLGNIQDLKNDQNLEFATTWFDGDIHVIEIEYNTNSIFDETNGEPDNERLRLKETERASLSWHLTEKEKRNIVDKINIPVNEQAISHLVEIVKPD
ncbi:MAG: patatin-like phospholipase family protein [Cyclobacteriaceae bacterium]